MSNNQAAIKGWETRNKNKRKKKKVAKISAKKKGQPGRREMFENSPSRGYFADVDHERIERLRHLNDSKRSGR